MARATVTRASTATRVHSRIKVLTVTVSGGGPTPYGLPRPLAWGWAALMAALVLWLARHRHAPTYWRNLLFGNLQ